MIKSILFGLCLSVTSTLLATNALASWGNELPGQYQNGKCMTFAVAYAEQHSGTKLIVMVKMPLAHLVEMTPEGAFADNMHPIPRQSRNLMTWYYENGYESRGWSIMTVIDWDHQSEQDTTVIQWLKQHEN